MQSFEFLFISCGWVVERCTRRAEGIEKHDSAVSDLSKEFLGYDCVFGYVYRCARL
jgi:hypothetical protein